VTIGFAAFAFGSVHRWASALVEVAIWLLVSCWLLRPRLALDLETTSTEARQRADRRLPLVLVTGVVLLGYGFLQTVPIPRAILRAVSPKTAEYYAHTVDVIRQLRPAEGSAADSTTSPEVGALLPMLGSSSDTTTAGWCALAVDSFTARSDLLRYLAYGCVLVLASRLSRPRRLLRGIGVMGMGVASFSLVQAATSNGYRLWFFAPYETGPTPTFNRVTGPFVNADHFALFVEMAAAIGIGLLMDLANRIARRRRRRVPAGAFLVGAMLLMTGIALVLGALFGTASRGGITGGMLGLVVAGVGSFGIGSSASRGEPAGTSRTLRWATRASPVLIGIVILAGGFLYAGSTARRELDLRLARSISHPDLSSRTEIWKQSWGMVGDFGVFGVGLGGWEDVYPRYQSFPFMALAVHHAHNDYVEWLTEVGIIGVVLSLSLAAAYVRWIVANGDIPAAIRWALFGAVAAVGWHEAFDFGLRVPANALLLASVLGLLGNQSWSVEEARARAKRPGGRFAWVWRSWRWRVRSSAAGPKPESRDPSSRDVAGRRSLAMPLRFAVVVSAAALTMASVRQFREFMAWSSARGGSTALAFAPRDAKTWEEIVRRLPDVPSDLARLKQRINQRIAELRPGRSGAYYDFALLESDPAKKLLAVNAAIYASPKFAGYRVMRAGLLDQNGEAEQALVEIERAAYLDPVSGHQGFLKKENASLADEVRQAANRGFERAIAESPKNPELASEVALIYWEQGRSEEAGKLWEKAAALSGDWASYGYFAGLAYAQAHLYPQAEVPFRKAMEESPDDGVGAWALATVAMLPQAKYTEAQAVLSDALAMPALRRPEKRSKLLAALYQVRWAANDRRGAAEALRQATKIQPRDAPLHFQLGLAYLELQEYPFAIKAFERAIALEGRNPNYYFFKGMALEKNYNLIAARDAYRKAAELDPANPGYVQQVDRVANLLLGASGN